MYPKTSVLTIGTFDMLHFGHVDFLRQCERLGTSLTVGVNSDEFAATFKDAPIMTQAERIHAIDQLDYPVHLNTSSGRDLIDALKPDVLAVGSDWARKDYLAQIDVDWTWLDARKIILAYVPYVQMHAISTTEIKARMRQRWTGQIA